METAPLGIGQVIADLPPAWTVLTGDRTIVVASDAVRQDLKELDILESPATKQRLLDRLRLAREGAAAFQRAPVDASPTRAQMEAVLARAEFRGIHGPTWVDRLQQRVLRFLARFADFHASAFPTLANLLIYGLIGLAVGLAAVWLHRSLRHRDPARPRFNVGEIEGDERRRWSDWLADARAEAERRQWRDAIRLAYWCGIAFLETNGAWRPDPSRTPREYVRALASSSEHGPTLQALTRLLERVWYGRTPASAEAFDEVLAHLTRLGCPTR